MTDKLAILIPSRNERYLTKTVEDCFAKAKGNMEVVVTLEGYWPGDWKQLTDKYPNLHTIHHGAPEGMRPAINSAAASAISRGAKWLMKLDAHCMLDEGFDVKLLADIEPNWIVVPRRKRLDAENWVLQDVGKPDIDYHYLSFPDDPQDFGGPGLNGKVWTQRIVERKDKPEYDIDDEMSSQGSCWVASAAYFEQLELMDTDTFGPFWCEAQEVLMKAWLSGGRCVVNKKTWYAHLHKGRDYEGDDGKKGRGYHLPEQWLTQGRNAAMKWLYNEAWSKQMLPFKSLIERFWPVPTWPEDWEERVYGARQPRNVAKVSTGHGPVSVEPLATQSGLRIVSARYGILNAPMPFSDHSVDVTARVLELVKDDALDIVVNNSTLTPNQNPYRGKKKVLLLTYAYGEDEVTIERLEKEWLIIGQAARQVRNVITDGGVRDFCVTNEGVVLPDDREGEDPPRTALALNDFLIRRFHISPQRLKAPMPIELPNFHRNDLAQLFAELGFNKGAEIGVAEGNYSEVLLKANPTCELLLVDPWHAYSDNPQNKSDTKHTFAYEETKRKIQPYGKARMLVQRSMDAANLVLPESLDFCYIDANHSFDFVMQDIVEWSKRVRSGGIVSGDDYYRLDQKRWVGGGVVEAVQAYVNAHRIGVWWIFAGHKSTDYFWVRP